MKKLLSKLAKFINIISTNVEKGVNQLALGLFYREPNRKSTTPEAIVVETVEGNIKITSPSGVEIKGIVSLSFPETPPANNIKHVTMVANVCIGSDDKNEHGYLVLKNGDGPYAYDGVLLPCGEELLGIRCINIEEITTDTQYPLATIDSEVCFGRRSSASVE